MLPREAHCVKAVAIAWPTHEKFGVRRGLCSVTPVIWPRQPNFNKASRGENIMSIGLILIILLVIFLLGGFSGRFGGYGYGYGHGGIGVIGVILIILVVLLLTGRI